MKPYYEASGVTIYHGDCRDVLPSIDLSGVGVVIADPPYGETSLAWDRWPSGWVQVVGQELAESVSLWCFGSMRMFLDRRDDFAGWLFAQDVVWEKHNGSGMQSDRFKRVHEHAVQWYRGAWADVFTAPVFVPEATKRTVRHKSKPPHHLGKIVPTPYASEDGGPKMMRSVLYARSCHGSAQHPTQKPEAIVRPLLQYSCAPGTIVLSPFGGAGTDLLAARSLGLKAIGIELQERYCEVAAQRLSQEVLNFAALSSRPTAPPETPK